MSVFFQSERLWFRAPELADGPQLTRWMNNPRVRKYLDGRVFPLNLAVEEKWIESLTESGNPPKSVVLLFGLLGQEEPIGSSGLHIHWVWRSAEWGILIGETQHWNQGFSREVAGRFLLYAFEDLNLNRVSLRVNAENAAAVRSYEKAGFVREGTLRKGAFTDGRYRDMLMMGVLREEWIEGRSNAGVTPELREGERPVGPTRSSC